MKIGTNQCIRVVELCTAYGLGRRGGVTTGTKYHVTLTLRTPGGEYTDLLFTDSRDIDDMVDALQRLRSELQDITRRETSFNTLEAPTGVGEGSAK